MTDARKAAEATVKTAQKAFDAANKKAQAAREKYLELQAVANKAARALTYAAANPDLFDDDPLEVVEPFTLDDRQQLPHGQQKVTVLVEGDAQAAIKRLAAAAPPVADFEQVVVENGVFGLAPPPPPVGDFEWVVTEEVPQPELPAPPIAPAPEDPWDAAAPVAAPTEPPKRKRRTKAQMEAARAIETSDDDDAIDGDNDVVVPAESPATSPFPSIF